MTQKTIILFILFLIFAGVSAGQARKTSQKDPGIEPFKPIVPINPVTPLTRVPKDREREKTKEINSADALRLISRYYLFSQTKKLFSDRLKANPDDLTARKKMKFLQSMEDDLSDQHGFIEEQLGTKVDELVRLLDKMLKENPEETDYAAMLKQALQQKNPGIDPPKKIKPLHKPGPDPDFKDYAGILKRAAEILETNPGLFLSPEKLLDRIFDPGTTDEKGPTLGIPLEKRERMLYQCLAATIYEKLGETEKAKGFLRDAIKQVQGKLTIPVFCFADKISGYGAYYRLVNPTFYPGERCNVYMELENFTLKKQTSDWAVRLTQGIKIFNEKGAEVFAKSDFGAFRKNYIHHIRDLFAWSVLDIPLHLPQGKYVLEVEFRDSFSQEKATAKTTFYVRTR